MTSVGFTPDQVRGDPPSAARRLYDTSSRLLPQTLPCARRLAPRLPVQVVPNGVDADYFAPLERAELPGTMIFTGAMSFPPNVTAVLHFYEHIMPLVRRGLPDARLIIAGRDPAPAVAARCSRWALRKYSGLTMA